MGGLKDAPAIEPLENGTYKGTLTKWEIKEGSGANGVYHQLVTTYEILDGPLQQGKYDPAGRIFPYYQFLPKEGTDNYDLNLSYFKTFILQHGVAAEDIDDELTFLDNMVGLTVNFEKVEKPNKNNPEYPNIRLIKIKPASRRG
jgi:hypothetical protein